VTESNYWNRTFRHRVSRRGVLRGAGVAGAGLAGAALIGCGDDDDDDDGGGTSTPTATATSGGSATPVPTAADPFANVKRGGTWRVNRAGDPPTIDAYGNLSFEAKTVSLYAHSRLYKIGARADINPNAALPEPDAAESAETEDGQTWTIKLKQGIKFHNKAPVNGKELTTDDVMFSWGKLTAPESPNVSMVSHVDKFEAVDDYTINVELNAPSATFRDLLADANVLHIQPTEADGGYDPRTDMIGSGPWVFEEYQPSQSIKYSKNPEWFVEGKPFMDGVELIITPEYQTRLSQFKAAQTTAAGINANDVLGLQGEQGDVQWRGLQPALLSFVYFSKPERDPDAPWQDPMFRQALSMTLDRDALTDLGYNVTELKEAGLDVIETWSNLIPAGFTRWWLDPQSARQGESAKYFEYNPEEAMKIFAANGWDGTSFKWQYTTNRYGSTFNSIAEAMGNYFLEAGLNPETEGQDYSSVYITQTFRSEFNGIAFGYETPFPEVGGYFPRMFGDDPANHSRISDPVMDEIAAKQAVELDEETRRELIYDAQVHNMEMGYYIPSQAGAGTGWTAYRPEVRGIVQTRSYGAGTETDPNFWLDV
jgi:peptide/nickel transport system substrate-binding protein